MNALNDRQNRTIICSVLFLDIVEYSYQPVTEQLKLRNRFNKLLFDALQSVAPNDRIILDTGDGAAVSFTGDPEDALFMALSMRDSIAAEPSTADPKLKLRYGINLGPVKLVKDLNGHPNMLGDGINVAQRIMSFSAPGQVLVSRSYYEVVSRLSDEYFRLFHYEGPRTDKHVREHEVYAVDAARPALQRPAGATHARRGGSTGAAVFERIASTVTSVKRSVYRKPWLTAALVAAVVLAAASVLRINRNQPDAAMAEKVAVTTPPVAASVEESAPTVEKMQTLTVKSATAPEGMGAPQAKAVQAVPATPAVLVAPAAQAVPAAPVVAMNKSTSGESMAVNLAVTPWGEVYVDDKKHGVSPPLNVIQVMPGRHKIEFRNTTFPSHVETINAKPGGQITIKHRFEEAE